jgi:hypothetical protein
MNVTNKLILNDTGVSTTTNSGTFVSGSIYATQVQACSTQVSGYSASGLSNQILTLQKGVPTWTNPDFMFLLYLNGKQICVNAAFTHEGKFKFNRKDEYSDFMGLIVAMKKHYNYKTIKIKTQ